MSDPFEYEINLILHDIFEETRRAMQLHPPISSLHEARGVIEEEFDEWWGEVKKKNVDMQKARKELIQIAAMCIRTIDDVIDPHFKDE